MRRIILAAFVGVFASTAFAEEIPLKSIWAYRMAGSQDAKELDPNVTAALTTWLSRRSEERGKAEECFTVPGEGKVALQAAANVLMNGAKPNTSYPEQEASLFFYSFSAPGYVTIDSIEREEGKVTVRFKVTTHEETISTTHFALIPLGKLPAGKLKVKVVEIKPEK